MKLIQKRKGDQDDSDKKSFSITNKKILACKRQKSKAG